ncbi:MAG: DUF2442 domain-containing protein [Treponema sp.]|nr:DUF2442 domain-containing protein [Treponema sp.]
MEILLDVCKVQPLPDFQLLLEFENSEKRTFDMKPLLQTKPFNRLKDPLMFSRAKIDYGTVVWPGNIDIAPETLYEDSIPC